MLSGVVRAADEGVGAEDGDALAKADEVVTMRAE